MPAATDAGLDGPHAERCGTAYAELRANLLRTVLSEHARTVSSSPSRPPTVRRAATPALRLPPEDLQSAVADRRQRALRGATLGRATTGSSMTTELGRGGAATRSPVGAASSWRILQPLLLLLLLLLL
eukprot:SAG11_NODE_10835_length_802_cov_2.709815_1_plen_127_part_10